MWRLLIKLLKGNRELSVRGEVGDSSRSAWFKGLLEAAGLNRAELYWRLKVFI